MVRPFMSERLSQVRWMVGFQAKSSVSVNCLSLAMESQVSFSWTYTRD
jgi:hypothetical protein